MHLILVMVYRASVLTGTPRSMMSSMQKKTPSDFQTACPCSRTILLFLEKVVPVYLTSAKTSVRKQVE